MSYMDSLNKQGKEFQAMAGLIPKEMKSFMKLHDVALEPAALDTKTKEMIALGISIAIKCDGCILSHVKTLHELGTTREEIGEVLKVALFMGGGPATAYGAKALAVYDEIAKQTK